MNKNNIIRYNGYEVYLQNKHNYSERIISNLTEELKQIYNFTYIRWSIDTDIITGNVLDTEISDDIDKSCYAYFYFTDTHEYDDISKLLEKYHNYFPNKSSIILSILNFKKK